MRQFTSVAQLMERLAELPQTAAVLKLELEYCDKNGYKNKIEWKK